MTLHARGFKLSGGGISIINNTIPKTIAITDNFFKPLTPCIPINTRIALRI
jgi:hypothetical protein